MLTFLKLNFHLITTQERLTIVCLDISLLLFEVDIDSIDQMNLIVIASPCDQFAVPSSNIWRCQGKKLNM